MWNVSLTQASEKSKALSRQGISKPGMIEKLGRPKKRKYEKRLEVTVPTRNVGAKKAVESFASSLRGGSVREQKRRYIRSSTNGGRGASLRSRNRATVDRSKRSAKAREALIAQKRMRKAKAAALKAKQMERQMQHVRRIKRLDTTIRPVLGNRKNQLPSRLDMEVGE